jgi:excisionase family DNA binding protein
VKHLASPRGTFLEKDIEQMNTKKFSLILDHIWAVAEHTLAEIVEARRSAWSVCELAELLNLSKVSLYELVKTGRLPAMKIGGSIRLDPKTTAAWLRGRLTS